MRGYTTIFVLKMGIVFPGGSVGKNLPANAGDTGSNPEPGRFHRQWINQAQVPQLSSLGSRAQESRLLSSLSWTADTGTLKTCALQQKKPLQWETHAQQQESSPCSLQLETQLSQK